MPTDIGYDSAGQCARGLIAALRSGSQERIGSVLDQIANLDSDTMLVDSRELEFRELLAGIAESVPMRDAALKMLEHVAATAG